MIEFIDDPEGRSNSFIVSDENGPLGLFVLAAGDYIPGDDDSIRAAIELMIDQIDNPPPPPLTELKIERILAAQAEQERRLSFGFRVTVGANEVILSSDAGQIEDIKLQVAELNAGIAWPASGIKMLARDGTEYQVTQPQFIAAFRAWRARVRALRDRYGELAQAIIAAAANEDEAVARAQLGAIDITAGWPAV